MKTAVAFAPAAKSTGGTKMQKNRAPHTTMNFKCPSCRAKIPVDRHDYGSEAGQMSQCDRCDSFIEFVMDGPNLIVCHARAGRVKMFHMLIKQDTRNIRAVIGYVRRYMPISADAPDSPACPGQI